MKKCMSDAAIQGFLDAPADLAAQFRAIVRHAFDQDEIDDLALLSISTQITRAVNDAGCDVISWVRSPAKRGPLPEEERAGDVSRVVG